jgi:immune inhibitor A
MFGHTSRVHRRTIALFTGSALTLAAAGIISGGAPTAEAATTFGDALTPTGQWLNPVAPQFEPDTPDAKVGQGGRSPLAQAWEVEAEHTGGNPRAARQLADVEQEAARTGRSPRQIKGSRGTQTAQLLTILVEFDDQAQDDFSDVMVPRTVFGDRTCVEGDVQSGPLHNNIPNPADSAYEDNNTFWVDDFSSEHFNRLLYSEEGITEPVRTDLNDGAGVDISGYTMRNHYLEMSKGAYSVDGAATPWVEVDHSEAWYGADRCTQDENGDYVAGPPQRMVGHPDNPAGPAALAMDAVNALMEQNPEFPLSDYDVEDQFDRDDDGIVDEPDGYVDHVVLVHAGEDKSGGGGEQGPYAIWAHSSSVIDGGEIGDTGLRLDNYIVQPEDSGVGVFSHEYGHDLGLPDLYDTSGAASSDIDFWDLMSSGSHSGPIFQSMPTHMGIWDKWVLGWADPEVIAPGDDERSVQVGQTSNTPVGTKDGVQVTLPNKTVVRATPHSGESMWWSNNDQDWADVRLQRTIDVPQAADARFWMWNDYVIESDWDFGFVEVSTDGGATWSEQKVYDADGAEVTTPDDYSDPNGRMADYGGKQYGLTGSTHGWAHHWIDLSAWAGQSVQVRMRYATDAAFLERGWYADDLSVTADGTTVWSDDAESNDGWTSEVDSFTSSAGEGWILDSGTSSAPHYYLAEWRTMDGFDEGLRYGYDTTYAPTTATDGAWKVQKVAYNAPGLLVWYRDTSYGNTNHVTSNLTAGPSGGAKGGLLLVDAHFDPLRHDGEAGEVMDGPLDNFPSRMQSSNAAFTTWGTHEAEDCFTGETPEDVYCTAIGNLGAVGTFSDALGWVPGIEVNSEGFWWRDADASTVIPSRGNQPYTTRIVNADGSPATGYYGANFGFSVAGSGNPGDAGVDYGVSMEVRRDGAGDQYAHVYVTPAQP